MKKILLTIIMFSVVLNASKHEKIFIHEAHKCDEVQFNHIVYKTKPDTDGSFDCNHLYVIDPTSKMTMLHASSIPMNDFTANTINVLDLPNNNLHF